MSQRESDAESSTADAVLAQPSTRRGFIGNVAAAAAVAVGAPALLAACGEAPQPMAPTATGGDSPRLSKDAMDPWVKVHYLLASTIGADSAVRVPALERAETGYLQRVIVDSDRKGTGLATVLRREYRWDGGRLTVSVENGGGRRWAARRLAQQSDLVYAMKDALAGNPKADGVLRESLDPGKPVVAVIGASVIQFRSSAQSDFYGNHLQVASGGFSDIFSPDTGGFRITATTRDFSAC
jgi:hypothetical protein